jgi:hypothetical protein
LTAPREFELVPDGEFLEVQSGETQAAVSRGLQLVLEPEFLQPVNFLPFQAERVIGARRRLLNSTQILESVKDR